MDVIDAAGDEAILRTEDLIELMREVIAERETTHYSYAWNGAKKGLASLFNSLRKSFWEYNKDKGLF